MQNDNKPPVVVSDDPVQTLGTALATCLVRLVKVPLESEVFKVAIEIDGKRHVFEGTVREIIIPTALIAPKEAP